MTETAQSAKDWQCLTYLHHCCQSTSCRQRAWPVPYFKCSRPPLGWALGPDCQCWRRHLGRYCFAASCAHACPTSNCSMSWRHRQPCRSWLTEASGARPCGPTHLRLWADSVLRLESSHESSTEYCGRPLRATCSPRATSMTRWRQVDWRHQVRALLQLLCYYLMLDFIEWLRYLGLMNFLLLMRPKLPRKLLFLSRLMICRRVCGQACWLGQLCFPLWSFQCCFRMAAPRLSVRWLRQQANSEVQSPESRQCQRCWSEPHTGKSIWSLAVCAGLHLSHLWMLSASVSLSMRLSKCAVEASKLTLLMWLCGLRPR